MAQKLQILRTADGYGLPLPMYESKDHMGLSLMAAIPDVIKLETGDIVCLPVGFAIGIPRGLCGLIVSVPDLVKEKGLVVTTAPALLNPADRGPIFVLIRNDSSKSQFINFRSGKNRNTGRNPPEVQGIISPNTSEMKPLI